MSPFEESPTAPPARPPRPSGRKIALIVGAVVVVCCGGLVGVGYGVYSLVGSSTDPMRQTATAFLDGLRTRDYPAAFGLLCDATQDKYDLNALVAAEADRPLADYSINGVYSGDRSGRVDGTVTATLTYADGTRDSRALPMVLEDDDWRVCGDPY